MKQKTACAVFAVALVVCTVAAAFVFPTAEASEAAGLPTFSMPDEKLNYTVEEADGLMWAIIDGEYPIDIRDFSGSALPMMYPMPPGSTNIHVYLDQKEVVWTNYTQTAPGEVHRTAFGDWWMISAWLENISSQFTLSIHYEHPIQKVNGSSYMFLYDLNILEYLHEQSPNSTAHFKVHFNSEPQNLQVYTAPPQSAPSDWKPKEFSRQAQGEGTVVSVEMQSYFGEDLPGDLVFVFSKQVGTDYFWLAPVVFDVVLVATVVLVKRRALGRWWASRKTSKKNTCGA